MLFGVGGRYELRSYQVEALDRLRGLWGVGCLRVVLCSPTGSGKTVLAGELLRREAEAGGYGLFVVDRVVLVDQAALALEGYGVRHGVVRGGDERWSPYERVQVCSIQTLVRRVLPREPTLVVYDECHVNYRGFWRLMDRLGSVRCVGLSATPFGRGMAGRWCGIVNVATVFGLAREGYLMVPHVYSARAPSESELEVGSDGEWSEASATRAGVRIVGDVVSEWERRSQEHFGGPAKTIVFASSVAHGNELVEAFRRRGHDFRQVSYFDDEARAKRLVAEFRRPGSALTGLVSCAMLTRGFDVPDVSIGISCKPYRKSLSSHLQEIGRIMRPAPGKNRAVWICHSGNVDRMAGDMVRVWSEGVPDLERGEREDRTARKASPKDRQKFFCPECGAMLVRLECPECGFAKRKPRSDVERVAGETHLVEIGDTPPARGLPFGVSEYHLWNAAGVFALSRARHADWHRARRFAYAMFKTILPDGRLPKGRWDARPDAKAVDPAAMAMVKQAARTWRARSRATRHGEHS